MTDTDLEELAKEARLLKKFKAGKVLIANPVFDVMDSFIYNADNQGRAGSTIGRRLNFV